MNAYPDLVIVLANGRRWRWKGWTIIDTKRGDSVVVHRFETPCRHCGALFTVTQKLPKALRLRYESKVQRTAPAADVEIAPPASMRLRGLELVNCKAHRGYGPPMLACSDLV